MLLSKSLVTRVLASVPNLYPLKIPENFWFSGIFRVYKVRTLARNGLINSFINVINNYVIIINKRETGTLLIFLSKCYLTVLFNSFTA